MKALQFTNDVLNQFLVNTFHLDESRVVLNGIIDANGNIPLQNQNKVVISLINVEKETARPFSIRNHKLSNGNYNDVNLSERYNLDVLLTSNFDDYAETLKFLNAVILFFQANTVLDASSFGNIPQGLNKLEFDIEKISYLQMHNVWTAMGAKYQPSVIYKMRLLTLQANENVAFVNAITKQSNTVDA